MKHKIKYLIFTLLLCSCEKARHTPESFSAINEFSVKKEQLAATTTKASGAKDEFVPNDTIYIYGYSKLTSGDTSRDRFMPITTGPIGGAIYEYYEDRADDWYRFQKNQSTGDREMGFWRTGLYHDFTAYYLENKPESPNWEPDLELEMDASGLPEEDLLWGETRDIHFSGEVYVIPQIRLKHQLSRIRVEAIHDTNLPTAENFKIESLELELDKQKGVFNVETSDWTYTSISHTLAANPGTNLSEENKLIPINVHEWWVLPECTISNFKLHLKRNGILEPIQTIDFQSHSDPDITTIITRPGYITVLRLEFGDIKSIIFTVSLIPWDVDAYGPSDGLIIED